MPIPITVPRLGWSMEEGTFVEWLQADGASVKVGDPLFVLESDKSAETIEAIDAGTLFIPPDSPPAGANVKVGQVLAYLAAKGETFVDVATKSIEPVRASTPQPELPTNVVRTTSAKTTNAIQTATPRARRAARELAVDVNVLTGSGRDGRVRERDVRAAATRQLPGRLIPHSPTRRTIAARMVAGVTQAAPVTLTARIDATNLVERRRVLTSPAGAAPSYTDLIMRSTAVALVQHPLLRAQWRDDGLFVPDAIDIAFAVDTEAGLLAPVVRGAETLSVDAIAGQTRDLIAQARAGKLGADQQRGATFTVSNLGSFGIDAFTPIIHLPQCAVLGIGRIVREPAVVDDQIVPRDRMTLSLTFDHRVVDGAPAARFLATLRQLLET